MSRLQNDNLVTIADIQKTFGTQGELIVKWWTNAPAAINLKEPVFIIIDGLPVPFYFKSVEQRGNTRAQVVFDDFETQKLAEERTETEKMESGKQKTKDDTLNSSFPILHYKVVDRLHGALGTVTGFLDIPGNPCLQVGYNGRELMIPFNEAIVLKTDTKKKTVETLLPEGLLEL